jgi:hypothetical protein
MPTAKMVATIISNTHVMTELLSRDSRPKSTSTQITAVNKATERTTPTGPKDSPCYVNDKHIGDEQDDIGQRFQGETTFAAEDPGIVGEAARIKRGEHQYQAKSPTPEKPFSRETLVRHGLTLRSISVKLSGRNSE